MRDRYDSSGTAVSAIDAYWPSKRSSVWLQCTRGTQPMSEHEETGRRTRGDVRETAQPLYQSCPNTLMLCCWHIRCAPIGLFRLRCPTCIGKQFACYSKRELCSRAAANKSNTLLLPSVTKRRPLSAGILHQPFSWGLRKPANTRTTLRGLVKRQAARRTGEEAAGRQVKRPFTPDSAGDPS